jgi:hypothetical protein
MAIYSTAILYVFTKNKKKMAKNYAVILFLNSVSIASRKSSVDR